MYYKFRAIKKNACVDNKTNINLILHELSNLDLVEIGNQGRLNLKLFENYHTDDEVVLQILASKKTNEIFFQLLKTLKLKVQL